MANLGKIRSNKADTVPFQPYLPMDCVPYPVRGMAARGQSFVYWHKVFKVLLENKTMATKQEMIQGNAGNAIKL